MASEDSAGETVGGHRGTVPDECQLCRLLDYRGDEIKEPEGMATVAREDGGTKIIWCCERCADELWPAHDFTPMEETNGE